MAVPLVEGWVARGFRERMAPQHWVRFVHQEIVGVNSADIAPAELSVAICDALLQQAAVGAGTSPLIISFLAEAMGSQQLVKTSDFVAGIARKCGVANPSRPSGYAEVLQLVQRFLVDAVAVEVTPATLVTMVATALVTLFDGHLVCVADVVGDTAAAATPGAGATDTALRIENGLKSLRLVAGLLGNRRLRLLVQLARVDQFDWETVAARWCDVKAARTASGQVAGLRAANGSDDARNAHIYTQIDVLLRQCQPFGSAPQPLFIMGDVATTGRKTDTASVLQLLAVLEYGAVHAPVAAEAAAWEVAVTSDASTLEDALHHLWFVALAAAREATTTVGVVRSACFAFARVPALIQAIVARRGLPWSAENGERALKRLRSHRVLAAVAAEAWQCTVEYECRGALARHGLLGNAAVPAFGLPMLTLSEVDRSLTEVFGVTDDGSCDAIDYGAILRELRELVGGCRFEWRIGCIMAYHGVTVLRRCLADLVGRCAACEPSRARVETALLCCTVDDWVCTVLLELPVAPPVVEHAEVGATLAEGILRAVISPPISAATPTSDDDAPDDSVDETAMLLALERASGPQIRAAGAAVGMQLVLAEEAGYSHPALGAVAMRLLRVAPGVYTRAVIWIAEHVAASLHFGRTGTVSSGAVHTFATLSHVVNPALVTHKSAGPDGRGCKLAAAVALQAVDAVLAAHAEDVDRCLPALAEYATKCGRQPHGMSPRAAAALLVPKDAFELVANATACGSGGLLDLRDKARGPLNTAWVVDHLTRAVSARPDPAAAYGLGDVAFAFAVHSSAFRPATIGRFFASSLPTACFEVRTETQGRALAELAVRLLAVLRGCADDTSGSSTDPSPGMFEMGVRSALEVCDELLLQPEKAPVSFPLHFADVASALGPRGLVHGTNRVVAELAVTVAHGLRSVGAETSAGPFFDLTSESGRAAAAALLVLPSLK